MGFLLFFFVVVIYIVHIDGWDDYVAFCENLVLEIWGKTCRPIRLQDSPMSLWSKYVAKMFNAKVTSQLK